MTYPMIEYEKQDRIATISVNRLEQYNTLRIEMGDALRDADSDNGVHVIVLQGAGGQLLRRLRFLRRSRAHRGHHRVGSSTVLFVLSNFHLLPLRRWAAWEEGSRERSQERSQEESAVVKSEPCIRRVGRALGRALACAAAGIAALAAGVGSAYAEPPQPDYARPGWYLGLGGIFAIEDISMDTTQLGMVPPQPPATDPNFGNSGGVDFRAGYRVCPRVAVEFDYQWQAGFDSSNPLVVVPFSDGIEIDTHLLSLNAKVFAATGRWQPYGLLGASLLIFNKEIVDLKPKPWDIDYGFAPRFGLGLDFYATDHWVLTLEGTYIVPVGVLDGANMGTVGVSFQYRL